MYLTEEAVAPAADGLYIAGLLGVVVEGFSEFLYGGVQAVLKDDGGIGWPEVLLDLMARDDLTGALGEIGEQAQRLVLDRNAAAVSPKFRCRKVYLELVKSKPKLA